MKDKNKINLVIYLFVAFVLGGLVMYFIAINTTFSSNVSGTNSSVTSTCRAFSKTVVFN